MRPIKVWYDNGTCTPDIFTQIATRDIPRNKVTSNAGAQVCGSTYATYSCTTIAAPNQLYNDGETYDWSIVPASAGSIISGQNTNSIQVLWNQGAISSISVKCAVRKCSGALAWPTIPINLAIVSQPTITALMPPNNTVCAGSPFNVNLGIGGTLGASFASVTWNFGDGTPPVTSTAATNATHTYTDPLLANTNYTITATVVDAGGCRGIVTRQFPITVLPKPIVTLSPPTANNLCGTNSGTLPQFNATVNIQSGFGSGGTIQWYRRPTAGATAIAVGAPGALTINVGLYGPGYYFAIVTNANQCSKNTNEFLISCTTTVGSCPSTCIVTAAVESNLQCQEVTAHAATTTCPNQVSQWFSNLPASATIVTNAATFRATNVPPGAYFIYPIRYILILTAFLPNLKYRSYALSANKAPINHCLIVCLDSRSLSA